MGVLGQPQSAGWGDPRVAPSSLVATLREIAANASRCNSYTFADEAEALARALEAVMPVLEIAAALLGPKVPPAVRVVPTDRGLRVWALTAATEPTLIKLKPQRRDQLAAAWDCLFAPLRYAPPRPSPATACHGLPLWSARPARPLMPGRRRSAFCGRSSAARTSTRRSALARCWRPLTRGRTRASRLRRAGGAPLQRRPGFLCAKLCKRPPTRRSSPSGSVSRPPGPALPVPTARPLTLTGPRPAAPRGQLPAWALGSIKAETTADGTISVSVDGAEVATGRSVAHDLGAGAGIVELASTAPFALRAAG